MIRLALLLLVFVSTSCRTLYQARSPLQTIARVESLQLEEGSGLIASEKHPGLFWTLNDSGNRPVLFLMDGRGRSVGSFRVDGAKNQDWETITTEDSGGLWIGDVGNNANKRMDLTLYRVEEPEPVEGRISRLQVDQQVEIHYPDQLSFPPKQKNFDCEAMFSWNEALYFLTKHRGDRDTKLYKLKLDSLSPVESNELTLVERFEGIGQVTGCDLHPDGKRLAVLTYSGVWMFERPEGSDHFLSGEKRVFRFPNWSLLQCEGVAWNGEDELMITNEQRDIFRFPLDAFSAVP